MLDKFSKKEITDEYVLAKIIRYNNRQRLQQESVAEHTCFVSMFCLKIMQQLKLDNETQRQVLILAALHDMAESKTSDIPHDVKANYPAMSEVLDKIEDDYYKESWPFYYNEIMNATPLVKAIIKVADTYSVIQYCYNEIDLGNDSSVMKTIFNEATKRLNNYINIVNKEISNA